MPSNFSSHFFDTVSPARLVYKIKRSYVQTAEKTFKETSVSL